MQRKTGKTRWWERNKRENWWWWRTSRDGWGVYQTSVSCGFGPTISDDDVQSSTRPTTFSLLSPQMISTRFSHESVQQEINRLKPLNDVTVENYFPFHIKMPYLSLLLVFPMEKKNSRRRRRRESEIRSHDIRDDVSSLWLSFGWGRHVFGLLSLGHLVLFSFGGWRQTSLLFFFFLRKRIWRRPPSSCVLTSRKVNTRKTIATAKEGGIKICHIYLDGFKPSGPRMTAHLPPVRADQASLRQHSPLQR